MSAVRAAGKVLVTRRCWPASTGPPGATSANHVARGPSTTVTVIGPGDRGLYRGFAGPLGQISGTLER
jgi:hypothetical protein